MGLIVSFINRKGGVGKTTIAVNVGGYLAKSLDRKVLLIDLDAQASASSWLMTQDRYSSNLVFCIFGSFAFIFVLIFGS